ncbi:MAG TPA: hypothetical protein VF137_06605 [Candidatus Dormibacteraeota bacterium]
MVTAAVQYAGWLRLGARRATEGSVEQRRSALRRWLVFAVAWQLAVLVGIGIYIAVISGGSHSSAAWIAPAAGALVGTALPLQVVVMSLMRGLRP